MMLRIFVICGQHLQGTPPSSSPKTLACQVTGLQVPLVLVLVLVCIFLMPLPLDSRSPALAVP